jgi:hypothetical protein
MSCLLAPDIVAKDLDMEVSVRRLFAACAVIAALALLAGCGRNSDSQELPEVKADYEATVRSLSWPDGFTWRSADERYKYEDEPADYEAGYGKTDAGMEWSCAWKLELLDAVEKESASRRDAAIEELAKLPTLHAWQSFDDGLKEFETEQLAKARMGDFSEIAADVDANCLSIPRR